MSPCVRASPRVGPGSSHSSLGVRASSLEGCAPDARNALAVAARAAWVRARARLSPQSFAFALARGRPVARLRGARAGASAASIALQHFSVSPDVENCALTTPPRLDSSFCRAFHAQALLPDAPLHNSGPLAFVPPAGLQVIYKPYNSS